MKKQYAVFVNGKIFSETYPSQKAAKSVARTLRRQGPVRAYVAAWIGGKWMTKVYFDLEQQAAMQRRTGLAPISSAWVEAERTEEEIRLRVLGR